MAVTSYGTQNVLVQLNVALWSFKYEVGLLILPQESEFGVGLGVQHYESKYGFPCMGEWWEMDENEVSFWGLTIESTQVDALEGLEAHPSEKYV